MARARRRTARIAAALALVVVGCGLAIGMFVRMSLPQRTGSVETAAVRQHVAIRFDARARPYVRAADLSDALAAEGFLHATERLWQMELLRRAGRGRLAELLGAGLLDSDRELWRAGVPRLAATLAQNADSATRRLVEAYVAGVNAGMRSLRVRPPEFLLLMHAPSLWTVEDVFAAGAMMAFDSANNAKNELLRFAIAQRVGPDAAAAFGSDRVEAAPAARTISESARDAVLDRLDALDTAAIAGLPSVAFGSNGWAVSRERSRSQAPLFAFDSHDALALPNLFYEIHLFYGDRQIRGWSTPGLPGVINGGNEFLLWGLTNIGDTQDLYLETRDAVDPRRFRSADGWYAARTETVSIPVRGRAEPERLEIVTTHNGPLIVDDPPIALRWVGHDPAARGLDALIGMNTARNWPEFRAAIDQHFAPSANVTYADVDGTIAFRTIGQLPVRGRGEGLVPQAGDDASARWRGMLAPADLPMQVNPTDGFVAAANARVTPPGSGVLVSADNAPGYRIDRIRDVLGAANRIDVEAMRALQVDWWNGQAAQLLAPLLAALEGAPLSSVEEHARSLLIEWSRQPINAPEFGAPLLFERWYRELADELFAEPLGADVYERLLARNYVLNDALDGILLASKPSTWCRGDCRERMRVSFQRAVAALGTEASVDPAKWRWDAFHRVFWRHELGRALPLLGRWLDRGPFGWGGGTATVGRASFRYDRGLLATHGATVRVVAELTRPIRLHAVIAGGQSGHPASDRYADQIPLWLAGRLEPLAATPEEVEGDELVLMPPGLIGTPTTTARSERR